MELIPHVGRSGWDCNVFNEHPLQNSNLIAGTTCPYQITNFIMGLFIKDVTVGLFKAYLRTALAKSLLCVCLS